MIKSFKDKRVEKLYQGEYVREFSGFDRQARKRLRILNQARVLSDLAALPGNHLEPLKAHVTQRRGMSAPERQPSLGAAHESLSTHESLAPPDLVPVLRHRSGQDGHEG